MTPPIVARRPYTPTAFGSTYNAKAIRDAIALLSQSIPPQLPTNVIATYTAKTTDGPIIADTTAGSFAVMLPQPNQVQGMWTPIVNIGTGTLTITGTVSGVVDPTFGQWDGVTVYSDGVRWIGLPNDVMYPLVPGETNVVSLQYPPGNVRRYGALGDGTTDDTTHIQNAIESSLVIGAVVFFPSATYKVTNTLTIYGGSQLLGEKGDQLATAFGIAPKTSRITFTPSSTKDLFAVSTAKGDTSAGFAFHIAIRGMGLSGTNANCRYAIPATAVIDSTFATLGIDGFITPVLCDGTINNRFENCYLAAGSFSPVSCVDYAGTNETTDVWTQCTFTRASDGTNVHSGVRFLGSSVDIRFTDCLFENLNVYGMELAKECQNITVTGGYSENVPLDNTVTNAMFKAGFTGSALVGSPILTVLGGQWQGRNAGTVGTFIDCDFCDGVQVIGATVDRYTNIFQVTANTRANSIFTSGIQGSAWTNFTNDVTKHSGQFPNVPNTTGGFAYTARMGLTHVGGLLDISAAAAGQIGFPATQNPSSDPNTLDDYEEGTWTPSIGGTATYTTQLGTYTKVGRLVTLKGFLTINALGTGSTTTISGLPFTSANDGIPAAGSASFFASLAVNTITLVPVIGGNAAVLTFNGIAASGATMNGGLAVFGAAAQVRFSIAYETTT